jgi:hypothetical protein
VIEPASCRPFKFRGKDKQASCEVGQGKRPALAEFGDQFDLNGRVERKH